MMESWSYGSEGKGFLFSDEVDLSVDSFSRSRNALMGWESKPSYNFDINKLISDGDAVENMEFMDLGVTDLTRKPCHSNTSLGALNCEVGCNSNKRVIKPSYLVASNSFYVEEESGSKISSSCLESTGQDSTLVDLKLGRLVDCRDAQSGKFLEERSVISSASPPLTAKKARTTNSCSQTPLCQVYGCNKDLSSSKDYHKRHKVCEVHSKTPKVIVNGNEQRFCQQCSRFHMLSEFDDSKRSCRRRLAGHNERRRKPQFNVLSDKSHKLLQSYQGTNFPWTYLPKGTSFVFPEMLPGGIIFPDRYDQVNLCNKKQHSLGNPPSATESYGILNAASIVQESLGISPFSRALSLLSAESNILSGHSTGIVTAKPLINQGSCAHDSLRQDFDKTSGLTAMGKCATKGFYLSGMNYLDVAQTESTMVPDTGHAVDLKLETDGVSQESDLWNKKYSCSPEHGCTVDLIKLSSQLKRVEQQRNSVQPKQNTDDLGCFLNS